MKSNTLNQNFAEQKLIKPVYLFLLFAGVFVNTSVPDNLNGTVRAGNFTLLTTRTGVLVVFVMRHDHLPPKSFKHLERIPIIRILLSDGAFPRIQKIFTVIDNQS